MKYSVESIEQILYDLDPFGTCCREFELRDEYESEAKEIFDLYKLGYGIIYSIDTVLKEWYVGFPGLSQEEKEFIANTFD